MTGDDVFWGPEGNKSHRREAGLHRADGFHPHPGRALRAWREDLALAIRRAARLLQREDADQ